MLVFAHEGFLRVFNGYRLNSILSKAPPEAAQTQVPLLPVGTPLGIPGLSLARGHLLFTATRSDIDRGLPGIAIGPLFACNTAAVRLHSSGTGDPYPSVNVMTDLEIGMALSITPNTFAMRRRAAYSRFQKAPFVSRTEGKLTDRRSSRRTAALCLGASTFH